MPKPKHVEPKLVNIEINGIPLQVPEGELLVEAVKRIGEDIPIFCYHKYMKPVGMCRMCLVEVGYKQPDGSVRKMPKPQASCTLPCTEGLVAWTESEQILKDRRAVLEFLLLNHPLDCPICDRGGECPLQNNTQFYGPPISRYIEIKRHLPKAFPLSKYVVLDLERCIHCGRCVRFTEEISGDGQLALLFRGAQMQPHTFQLTEFTSKFSGNVIEICPVGALTNRTYRFRARPWDIVTQKSLCTMCSNGCNLYFDSRAGKVVRINARENPEVNETWTCDKGKFEQVEFLNAPNRITQPMQRNGVRWEPISWAKAYEMLLACFNKQSGASAGLTGTRLTNEALYLFQKLMRAGFQTNHIDHRMTRYQGDLWGTAQSLLRKPPTASEYRDLEATHLIFVFGTDLIEEQPMVFLRTRKAWRHYGVRTVVAYPVANAVEAFAEQSFRYRPDSELALVQGLLNILLNKMPEERLMANAPDYERLKTQIGTCTPAWTQEQTGIPAEQLLTLGDTILETPSMIILAGLKVWNHPQSEALIEHLMWLTRLTGNCQQESGGLNLLPLGANEQGANDMGVLPNRLPGYGLVEDDTARAQFEQAWQTTIPTTPGYTTQRILEGCLREEIRALYIAGANPLVDYYDPRLAEQALRACEFVVVQDSHMTETAEYADLLLPACTVAESEGTYTNWERRVQRFWRALEPVGESKPDWLIFAELWLRQMCQTPPFNPREVMCEIADLVPLYAECTYDALGDLGKRWN